MIYKKAKRQQLLIAVTVCAIVLTSVISSRADAGTSATGKTYTVGYIAEPCYVIETPSGQMQGLIADTWHEIAKRTGIDYTPRQFKDAAQLREKLIAGEVDFFLNGIERTSKNEDIAAFSHVCHVSNLTILLIKSWHLQFIENFKAISVAWSAIVLQIFVVFLILSFIYANILWFLEIDDISLKGYWKGVSDAMWCVIAMKTTIGFGDIVPRRLGARLFSVVIWFTGVLLVTLISAEIISEFSANKINWTVTSFSDLKNNTVAVPANQGIIDQMKDIGAKPVPVSNYKDIYDILKEGKADAGVLYYLAALELSNKAFKNGLTFNTIKSTLHEAQWQVGMPWGKFDEGLFNEINCVILDMRGDGTMNAIVEKWIPLELS